MTNKLIFTGEESTRFTRFAQICLDIDLTPNIEVNGREPLTSQQVHISGKLIKAVLDGYIRYVIIEETHSNIEYWVAGSNATRSIATKLISFSISSKERKKLEEYSSKKNTYIAFLSDKNIDNYFDFIKIEKCLQNHSNECLDFLLKLLQHSNKNILLESAFSLRSFWEFITVSNERQEETELYIHEILNKLNFVDAKIALVENLGYIGTSLSIELLSQLIRNQNEHKHIRWAASIALGRLPNVEPIEHLIFGLKVDLDWVVAGTLLSIARRIDTIQAKNKQLEDVFFQFINSNEKNSILIRYACFGLSRLKTLDIKTLDVLVEIVGNKKLSISNRGYAAMPLVSNIEKISEEHENKLSSILNEIIIESDILKTEPEAIWGLEFLCDLSVLLELESVAAHFYKVLSSIFNDWRSQYYKALSYYELAEAEVKAEGGESAILYLIEAKKILPSNELPDGAFENLKFKKDIITARLQLQNALNSWMEVIDTNDLIRIEEILYNTGRMYMTYAIGNSNLDENKNLVKREKDFLKNTVFLLSVLSSIVKLDNEVRNVDITEHNIKTIELRIFNIIENMKPLKDKFKSSFARTLQITIENSLQIMEGMQEIVENKDVSLSETLKIIRSSIIDIKSLFWKATWPMPGRACPISGLGKGSFKVHIDGLNGDGTEDTPLEYPKNTPVLLKIVIDIEDMAPGGITTASIICKIAGNIIREPIPVVEGPYTCTLLLPNILSPIISIKCDLSLAFEARDCSQVTYSQVLYIKSI